MNAPFKLTSADGFQLGAYRADPKGPSRGGVVVIQEIFGVNHHIRSVCDRLAALGYTALAPALFDRSEPDFECGYSPDEVANARKFIADPDWDKLLSDSVAAIDLLKKEGPVAIIGFCMGGTIAFMAATKVQGLAAAVGFYGGQAAKYADSPTLTPTQLHFGEEDHGIPLTSVDSIRSKRPEVEVYVYPGAGHGFECDERASFHAESAQIAWGRTVEFLGAVLPRKKS